ncbi:hypothetical protein CCO03_14855 [Comamonas serinivorans]|uniref:DUF3011 domain-containing protein n=1 Tax=Comamonas serinivorans TaxID=1082851 RepID=A0A1Y0ERB1_9BURK|nr:DUF3011 domain-containing protein [Comamonas serinivorans]ARU05792.1 hypothetical protein CCO03_14855 [Comamonas serinivorans]
MIRFRLPVSLAALMLGLSALPAQAQYGGSGAVTCESQDGRYNECRTPFRNPVVAETLSSSSCIEGRTWGERGSGTVWVNDGCRARFVEGRGGWSGSGGQGGAVRCESEDGRYRECPTPGGMRMVISRQLSESSCIEGRSWGNRGNSIWVRDGCRAEFVAANAWGGGGHHGSDQGRTVTCSSENRRQTTCNWNSRWGRPRLIEQLSSDSCREGSSWGYDGRGRLWVDRGCRARFGTY